MLCKSRFRRNAQIVGISTETKSKTHVDRVPRTQTESKICAHHLHSTETHVQTHLPSTEKTTQTVYKSTGRRGQTQQKCTAAMFNSNLLVVQQTSQRVGPMSVFYVFLTPEPCVAESGVTSTGLSSWRPCSSTRKNYTKNTTWHPADSSGCL